MIEVQVSVELTSAVLHYIDHWKLGSVDLYGNYSKLGNLATREQQLSLLN